MNNALIDSLDSLGQWLASRDYSFTTPTPATHARINGRRGMEIASSLRDIFGWSRPFSPELLSGEVLGWLRDGDLLEIAEDRFRSRARYSSVGGRLYAHSAFPTIDPDSIFFGPDTYRFIDLIRSELGLLPVGTNAKILDICCGAGPGGIEAALVSPAAAPSVTFADINPAALDFARANARLSGVSKTYFAEGDLFGAVSGEFDLIIANPPYLVDAANRIYRNGGGLLGTALSERIVGEGISSLAPGGRLILYTGVAIVDGVDLFLRNIKNPLDAEGVSFRYRELDPDVFGEELDTPAYEHAERIAAVALVAQRSSS
ncbi:MAG: class I SAM-dependent methyltransferase [Pseudomonadota bacterium]